jgi:hypothetical protein
MSDTTKSLCPSCGKHASGNFCHHCGSTLGGKFCNQCGSEVSGDGKFCNQCGAPAKPAAAAEAPSGGGGSRQNKAAAGTGAEGVPPTNSLPWWFAGIAMFGLIMVVGWNMVQPGPPPTPGGSTVPMGSVDPTGPGTTDISQMSPREAADRQAFDMARPLDMDGLYHLALLQRGASQFDGALGTAQQMLQQEPNHTLALNVAAAAAVGLGRLDEAEGYYRLLLEHIDTEIGRPLPEYQGHATSFPSARAEAEAFLAAR